ncbi:DUF1850 domain-containing protein [Haloquadratum walsbyi]|jgi:Uncharacterized conserved protein|uniref:DUF1850 domain-containing protein n=1 Tax=Haloquadratum walsbyi J07HQW2 TaxID=1238425 RepID=U1NGF5_9EURY|nr:DUF1850 domain-containing protein [Haloquadratum walsbyi]ERG96210.1 MAG: hypothetical protein J07HQW2_02685 [Haloquadratum walsbyi J07HQW2]
MQYTTTVRFVIGLGIIVLIVASVGTSIAPGFVLIVEDADTEETYIHQPVTNGTTFSIEYTHSVEKTRVSDEYQVSGQQLINTRMEFESYGWGLPTSVSVTNRNGTFVYEPSDPITTMSELFLSPGRIANHTLIVSDQRYSLITQTNANDVRIHIERQSPMERVV